MCLVTDLDPPRDFKAVGSTETSLTVSWQRPQAKVSGYRLVYMSTDGQVEQVEIPASATTYVLSNLLPGMSYTLTLAAERGQKRSKPVSLTASTGGLSEYIEHGQLHFTGWRGKFNLYKIYILFQSS